MNIRLDWYSLYKYLSILIKLKNVYVLDKEFNEIKESVTFYSSQIDEFSIKLGILAAKLNDNGKKLIEV